jgi:hypothetical protein
MWCSTHTQLGTICTRIQNVLSGSRLVQGKGHRVEIDTVVTRLVCNTGTRSTLHMSYDE